MEQEKVYAGRERKYPTCFRDDREGTLAPKKQALVTASLGPELDVDLEELLLKARLLPAQKRKAQDSSLKGMQGAKDASHGEKATKDVISSKEPGTPPKGPRNRVHVARTCAPSNGPGAEGQGAKKIATKVGRLAREPQRYGKEGGDRPTVSPDEEARSEATNDDSGSEPQHRGNLWTQQRTSDGARG
ncbi:hypothetical protein NDU88_002394 [Pleurodeles waltl]|uniref:Uncharacterized protein n=1 Tax=Pleurodeles waltl TaxID=8319 RepID=A0AAV7P6N0_PLEWA|nr:hypothetical protein NDU88_002394 [Pleurodeles waltl]